MVERMKSLWSRRPVWVIAVTLVIFAAASFGVARIVRSAPEVPTAEVTAGEWVDWVQLRGEVKAVRSVVMTAPSGAGDLQIVSLAQNGKLVKKGEVVVQFDTTTQQRTLDQRSSELRQAEAEIQRAEAQARITDEQNQTELMRAKYDVERARLETSKQEILSAIEGEKTKLALANAEQRLREMEAKLAADRIAAQANIESRKQKRDKERFDVDQTQNRMAAMTLRAPIDGMVNLMPNYRAGGMFGGSAPEFRAGDRAWSGAAVAELPDLSAVRVTSRVDETDRGRLKAGQRAAVRVDAVPDKEFPGRVEEISALAKLDHSNWPPAKNFDVWVRLDATDARLRPGMSGNARVAAETIRDALQIPAEAAFQRNGRTVVFVLRGAKFEMRPVEVARRGNGKLVIARGLKAGERVALKDPTVEPESGEKSEGGS